MDVVDGAVLLAMGRLPRLGAVAEIRGSIADIGVQPVAERHAGTARGRLGSVAHGWIDAVDTPRYARIHDLVRFRLRRHTLRHSFPARPDRKTIEFGAGRLPQRLTFSRQGKYRVKECGVTAVKLNEAFDFLTETAVRQRLSGLALAGGFDRCDAGCS